jgi:cobalt/nickel transport system ATP-binding protein
VRHRYEDGATVHLCGLDFIADKGERVALLGPNGAGKTTMLFHVLGLLRSEEGTVRVLGADPAREWESIRDRIGIVLQNVDEQLIMPTVFDDVAFSARQRRMPELEVRSRVESALDLLGISELSGRVAHNLSGGEKRKVAMAGAMVLEPDLLVLDEPFEGLDPYSRSQMIDLLDVLAQGGATVVLTTHDIDSVPEFADYCYVLKQGGEIALEGAPAEIFAQAARIAESNIKPPVLAELFAALKAGGHYPGPAALTIDDAVRSLTEWSCREEPGA